MLQLQGGGWRRTLSFQLLRLQACQGRDEKEKVSESTQDYNGKSGLFQQHHPPPLGQNQQQVPSRSIQASNENSSSLNDIFKLVAIVFYQIMTELNGAKSE
jgi:hypothetical protein